MQNIKSRNNIKNYTSKRLCALLERSQRESLLFSSTLDSIQSMVLLLDNKSNTVYVNKYAMALFRKNKYTDYSVWKIFENHAIAQRIKQAIDGIEQVRDEIIECDLFQDISNLCCTVHPRIVNKEIAGWILLLHDYSELLQTQKQIRRSDYLHSLTNISSGIAHELRNPLGAISIHLQIIRKKLDAVIKERTSEQEILINSLDVVDEEIENMNKIINLFLNNLKIGQTEMLEHDLNDLLDAFRTFIKPDIQSKNITSTAIVENPLPLVRVSKPSVIHVLLNIVRNAIESLQEGGKIIFRTYTKDGYVCLSISDTGKGVEKDIQEKIFSPYFTTKVSGSGIGLAISDKIMRLHHGKLIIDTRYKDGASFILMFPSIANEHQLIEA